MINLSILFLIISFLVKPVFVKAAGCPCICIDKTDPNKTTNLGTVGFGNKDMTPALCKNACAGQNSQCGAAAPAVSGCECRCNDAKIGIHSQGRSPDEAACRQTCTNVLSNFESCVGSSGAAAAASIASVPLKNPLSTEDISTLAGNILKALLGIIGSIALLMMVFGGFLWLTAAGNTERIKKGKDTLIWAAIGLAFIFSSYILARFVFQTLLGTK